MRGKVQVIELQQLPIRITPAYAGKSGWVLMNKTTGQDHPRVCGEKHFTLRDFASQQGSPPRMRGKGELTDTRMYIKGITPAYAGKSMVLAALLTWVKDHPRVCGEKTSCLMAFHGWLGSPPRMRGKD